MLPIFAWVKVPEETLALKPSGVTPVAFSFWAVCPLTLGHTLDLVKVSEETLVLKPSGVTPVVIAVLALHSLKALVRPPLECPCRDEANGVFGLALGRNFKITGIFHFIQKGTLCLPSPLHATPNFSLGEGVRGDSGTEA